MSHSFGVKIDIFKDVTIAERKFLYITLINIVPLSIDFFVCYFVIDDTYNISMKRSNVRDS